MWFLQVFLGLLPLIAAKVYVADVKLDNSFVNRIGKLLGTRELLTFDIAPHHDLKNLNSLALDVLTNLTKKYSFCQNCRVDEWPKKEIDKLFKIEVLKFRIDYEDVVNTDVIMNNVEVKGVQELKVQNYKIDQQKLNLDFDLFFPELSITALYEMDGTIEGGQKILHPTGNFIFTLHKLNLKGRVLAGKSEKYYFLEDFKITPNIDKSTIMLSGLMEKGKINNLFGLILNKMSDSFIRSRINSLRSMLNKKASEIINRILTKIEIVK